MVNSGDDADGYPGRTHRDSPRCDGHETRPQSRIAPPSATNDWRFCPECWQTINEHDLDPGVDFAAGELRSEVELDDV